MLQTILGTKDKMDQAFKQGRRVPVTKILTNPSVVTQIKSVDSDGYWAVQLGFGEKKLKRVSKPIQGHLKGAISKLKSENKKGKKMAPRFLREVKVSQKPEVKVGDIITISDIFSIGDSVSVTGISKGKGFAGVMKRWGFAGGQRTHGQSDRQRSPGSIGQGTTPGRVRKGKKMPGRMGAKQVHVKNLKVIKVDMENNELMVSGPVPGAPGGLLMIKKTASAKPEKRKNEKQNAPSSDSKEKVKENDKN